MARKKKKHNQITLIDLQNPPRRIFEGNFKRVGVEERLEYYLQYLRTEGLSLSQAAAKAGMSYCTIITHRGRNEEFAEYERAAQQAAYGQVTNTIFRNATDVKSKQQVAAASLYLRYIGEWVEARETVMTVNQTYDFSTWTDEEMEVAEKFYEVLKRHEGDEE